MMGAIYWFNNGEASTLRRYLFVAAFLEVPFSTVVSAPGVCGKSR